MYLKFDPVFFKEMEQVKREIKSSVIAKTFTQIQEIRMKYILVMMFSTMNKKVQVGKDQEKAQSEKDSHSKNRGGKKQTNNQVLIP